MAYLISLSLIIIIVIKSTYLPLNNLIYINFHLILQMNIVIQEKEVKNQTLIFNLFKNKRLFFFEDKMDIEQSYLMWLQFNI